MMPRQYVCFKLIWEVRLIMVYGDPMCKQENIYLVLLEVKIFVLFWVWKLQYYVELINLNYFFQKW